MGLKIGSTTGYTDPTWNVFCRSLRPRAMCLTTSFVPTTCRKAVRGRLGMYKCMIDLVVYPPNTIVKVDDTEPGIAEGVAAGCLAIGVALSGKAVGLTPEEVSALPEPERAARRENPSGSGGGSCRRYGGRPAGAAWKTRRRYCRELSHGRCSDERKSRNADR